MKISEIGTSSFEKAQSTIVTTIDEASGSLIQHKAWCRQHFKARAEHYYQKWVLELLLRQIPLPPSKDGRHIPLAASLDRPLVDERRGHAYISNDIRSSRYTVWDFLPKQFFFQATRLANFYFICIGIPQAIPGFSTTGSYTTILPLCFFLLLTIVKEGYDDYRRHRLDKVENNTAAIALRERHCETHVEAARRSILRTFSVLSRLSLLPPRWRSNRRDDCIDEKDADEEEDYHWTRVRWHDIRVGDVLKIKRDEAVPADVVLLHAEGEKGTAYVETMALDGETNLKSKQALSALRDCSSIAGIRSCEAMFVSEDPDRDLYTYNGSVAVGGNKFPLTLANVALRGTVIRNTKHVIGLVVNTGEECKIRMNANHHPKAKKPRLEHFVNQIVLTLIVYVVVLSVGCSMGYILWHHKYEVNAWYLADAPVPFKQIIIGLLIMFNNVIPLALYISLEIVKVGQMLMVASDMEMYDDESDTPMRCNTNTILENLGQVKYVLSDKTGTLTENVMSFRGLSVAGTAWSHRGEQEITRHDREKMGRASTSAMSPTKGTSILLAEEQVTRDGIVVHEKELSTSVQTSDPSLRPHMQRKSTDHTRQLLEQPTTVDLLDHIRHHPEAPLSKRARNFILGLAICHTALPEPQEDGSVDFQASSPDELALVRAARDLGTLVAHRSTQSITLLENVASGGKEESTYEILKVIEFSSKRKRMSIVVRCPDGEIWLLCKGADSVIIPRLQQASLANRKSQEVRRSIQIERDLRRKSGQYEPKNSFGGRPSLTIRRRSSMDIQPVSKRNTLEVPRISEMSTRLSADGRNARREGHSLLDGPIMSNEEIFSRCFRHLDDFACQGLRTLLFAHREISEDEYRSWEKIHQDAATSLVDRQARIEAAGDSIEQGLDLLGASAIEDKLQKGVPETIDKLRRANMKIWMLTGDKRETAINIAYSARICKPESEIFILDGTKGSLERQLNDMAEDLRHCNTHVVIVIDGHTLADVQMSATMTDLFYSLTSSIDSVICCRASPAQKASVVEAIQKRQDGLALAIGDGANDIAMITASHVGIGISGKEGLQAARVADFSIAQFRFLQRLLLVHGRWNYVRTAKFILWTYYKEYFFYLAQAAYQHYDGYTGSSLYENWSLTVLNTLFTSLCVIVPGIFEQDLEANTLLAVPELYVHGQRDQGLNLSKYLSWIALATLQGIAAWYVPYALNAKYNVMGDNGTFAIGDLCFSLAIMWTNLKLLILETHHKTTIVLVSWLATSAGWWAWNGFLAHAYSDNLSPFDVRGGFTRVFGKQPSWWLALVVTLAILIAFELLCKSAARYIYLFDYFPAWTRLRSASLPLTGTAEEVDVAVWQEMQKDPKVRRTLARMAASDEDDGGRVTDVDDHE